MGGGPREIFSGARRYAVVGLLTIAMNAMAMSVFPQAAFAAASTSVTLARTTGSASQAYSTTVVFTATVQASGSGNTALSNGHVAFKNGSTTLFTASSPATGSGTKTQTFTYTATALAVASYSITATYSGDPVYPTGTSS